MPIAKPIINNAGTLAEAPAATALDYLRIGSAAFAASLSINTNDNDIVAVTLTGNVTTLTLTGTRARFTIRFIQDATGARTVTAGSSISFNGGVAALTLDPAANSHTIVTFMYDVTTSKFDVIAASFGDTVAITEGGTGATSAAGARTNLGLGAESNVLFADITYTGALTGGTGAINIGSGQLVKTTSGHFGMGVTPASWGGVNARGLEVGVFASLSSNNAYGTGLGFNTFFDGTNYTRRTANLASFLQCDGSFRFRVAATGAANSTITFTDAMIIDNAGTVTASKSRTTTALSVSVTANTGTNYALNLATAEYFKMTLTGNVVFTVSNVPSDANSAYSFVVRLAQDATGGRTVTWFNNIRWPAGTVPTQTTTASRYDLYVFTTDDAGTSWTGTVAGQNFTV
jgi:hypothetical protein